MYFYRTEIDDDLRTIVVKDKKLKGFSKKFANQYEVASFMNDNFYMEKLAEEYVYLICMNSKVRPIGVFQISKGDIDFSFFSIRDIFTKTLLLGSKYFMVVHNHPSGEYGPSKEDMDVSDRIEKASILLDVSMLDFLIIAREGCYSFCEHGLLGKQKKGSA